MSLTLLSFFSLYLTDFQNTSNISFTKYYQLIKICNFFPTLQKVLTLQEFECNNSNFLSASSYFFSTPWDFVKEKVYGNDKTWQQCQKITKKVFFTEYSRRARLSFLDFRTLVLRTSRLACVLVCGSQCLYPLDQRTYNIQIFIKFFSESLFPYMTNKSEFFLNFQKKDNNLLPICIITIKISQVWKNLYFMYNNFRYRTSQFKIRLYRCIISHVQYTTVAAQHTIYTHWAGRMTGHRPPHWHKVYC